MTLRAGLLAEFESAEALLAAIHHLRGGGYSRLDAFTPWPVKGLDEALSLPRSRVPLWTMLGGAVGAAAAYLIQWWTNARDYPLNVGARPAHAAPAFVPITFETMVLCAGLSALFSFLSLCRLPELWSPVFEAEGFASASIDRFWVGVDSSDDRYDRAQLAAALRNAGALRVVPFGTAT